jgi:hypothetical protein
MRDEGHNNGLVINDMLHSLSLARLNCTKRASYPPPILAETVRPYHSISPDFGRQRVTCFPTRPDWAGLRRLLVVASLSVVWSFCCFIIRFCLLYGRTWGVPGSCLLHWEVQTKRLPCLVSTALPSDQCLSALNGAAVEIR